MRQIVTAVDKQDAPVSVTKVTISPDALIPLYTFRRPDEVKEFLQTYPFLIPLLVEACGKIETYFPPDPSVVLEVVTDPEALDDRQLVAFIQTDRHPEDALARLDRLDTEWWLDASRKSENKLCIHIEYHEF